MLHYVPLQTITTTSNVATINFTSIPQNYKDLVLVSNYTCGGTANQYLNVRFNSINSTTYGYQYFGATTSGVTQGQLDTEAFMYVNGFTAAASPTIASSVFNIMDYSKTTIYKNVLNRCSVGTSSVELSAQQLKTTSAVTSINLFFSAATGSPVILAGSTFSLYGIVG